MILEDVIEKAAYARPGYVLASFKDAALPVYALTTRVLTLEKKPISPIEEACLRAVEAGLSAPGDICGFLGLSKQILNGTLASLNSREQINYIRSTGDAPAQIILTAKGRMVLTEAKTIEPEERLVKLVFDPLLKKVVFVPPAALFRPKDVRDRGWMEIPLCGAKRPEVEDVPIADIDKALQRIPRGQQEVRELLAVRRIERRELQFTPCVVLYYRSQSYQDVQVAFYREDGASVAHETSFAEMGGPELIGAKHLLQPSVMPPMEGLASTSQQEVTLSEIDALGEAIAAASASAISTEGNKGLTEVDKAVQRKAEQAISRLKAMTQRSLRCHEHPKMLQDALTKTQARLLIVSPWITDQVVNDMFIRSLEVLLRNKVDVFIGYGLANEDGAKGNDKAKQKNPIGWNARKELDRLKTRFPNLTLKFLGNTHRKQLVSDNRFAVITSFNWLSFKGDPKLGPRDELGYLVSEPTELEKIFQDGLKLINEGYDHPPSSVPSNARSETAPSRADGRAKQGPRASAVDKLHGLPAPSQQERSDRG